jgi:hypothetical protein
MRFQEAIAWLVWFQMAWSIAAIILLAAMVVSWLIGG